MRGNCWNGILLYFHITGAVFPSFLSEIAGFQGELFNNLLKKKSQLFSNGILHLQEHEGIYCKMCHLGEWGILFLCVLFCFWKTLTVRPQRSCGLICSCSLSSLWSWHFVQIVFIIMCHLPDTSSKTDAWCQFGGWVCRHLGAEEDHHKLLRHWSNIAKWKYPELWLKWSLCKPRQFQKELHL